MFEFLFGWLLGKNTTTPEVKVEPNVLEPVKEIEIPKVYRYVPIPEIYDFDATIEGAYKDYENAHLVTIHKGGHIVYYLEVEVPYTKTKWGKEDLLDNI